jgi:hypothetical protein
VDRTNVAINAAGVFANRRAVARQASGCYLIFIFRFTLSFYTLFLSARPPAVDRRFALFRRRPRAMA